MTDFKDMTPEDIISACQRHLVCERRAVFTPGRVSVRAERSPLAPVIGYAEIGFFGVKSIKIDDDKHDILRHALACAREATIRIEEFPGAMPFVSITAAEVSTS